MPASWFGAPRPRGLGHFMSSEFARWNAVPRRRASNSANDLKIEKGGPTAAIKVPLELKRSWVAAWPECLCAVCAT
jgi:hypothetical protein